MHLLRLAEVMMQRGARREHHTPTIVDVASRAGVSTMTVSRVINGTTNVRAQTRDRVLTAIRDLRFRPNRSAQSLASAARIGIGFLYSNPSAGYLSEFLFGSVDQASHMDIQLILQKCPPDDNGIIPVERLVHSGIDGLILPPRLCDCDAVIAYLENTGLPAVAVATARPAEGLSIICIDDYRAAREMTTYILSLGHRDVGFIVGDDNLTSSARRLPGYRDALERAGIAFREKLVALGSFTYRSGLDAAEKLLAGKLRPTAIFASNDEMAAAVIAVAQVCGLSVPRDLTVCGFDDTALATAVWPELTTIRQPIADMARSAVDLLASEIRKKRRGVRVVPQHLVQGFRLIERHSSGPLLRRPGSGRTVRPGQARGRDCSALHAKRSIRGET